MRLSALELKKDVFDFADRIPYYHLTSWKELTLIQKPLAQIPEVFHEHWIAGKKMINDKYFNETNYIVHLYQE